MSSVDSTSPDSDDEITIDPEATNAADSNWLAELRAKARSGGQSMAELLDDDPGEAEGHPGDDGVAQVASHDRDLDDLDDDVTIDHRGNHDAIRQAVKEARSEQQSDARPADETPRGPQPTATPIDPAVTTTPATPDSAPAPALAPTAAAADSAPVQPQSGEATVPRWEAPPRLDTGRQATSPALIRGTTNQRRLDWRIAAAVVVALLAGFAIAVFAFGGSDDPPPVDPNATTTVVDETDTEEP